jgi:hypothetical protein
MVETLERLIEKVANNPKQPRTALFKELLRSETFLLSLGAPLEEEQRTRVLKAEQTFSIWADKDSEMGGVWVPVFPARDTVTAFVTGKKLRAPKGKEYLWMGHGAGEVFGMMRSVRYFAGLKLYLSEEAQVPLNWSDVKALSEGRLPADKPEIYDLPVAKLTIPSGVRIAFGRVDAGPDDRQGRLLCLPQAGHFRAHDVRKLVRLNLGRDGWVWMACRHFLQVLRFTLAKADSGRYLEDMLRSLVSFEMYGEAEALCEWLAHKSNEVYAWVCLAAIYGKTGRLAECAALCRKAAVKYPEEKAFHINGARALVTLGRKEEALKSLSASLEKFPAEPALLRMRDQLGQAPQ